MGFPVEPRLLRAGTWEPVDPNLVADKAWSYAALAIGVAAGVVGFLIL